MYYRQLSRQLRKTSTYAEQLLWQHLRLKQMGNFKFRRQHPIGKYILDFICLETKLVIELDGGQHNKEESHYADAQRTDWLEQQGYKVLRFWNHEVLNNLSAVKETIWNALITPALTLPLKGGGNMKRASLNRRIL